MANHFESVIRAAGPVIDPESVRIMYAGAHAGGDGGAVERDLVYGADPRHRLDVYSPAAPVAGGAPVLVFLHGGGFIRGDKAQRAEAGHYFARHDVLTILPNYRLGPEHRWPAGAQDAAAVFEWARANVARFGGDPNRIVLAGESAGAAHVAAAVLIARFHPAGGLPVSGAILVSGVYNAELELKARRQLGIATPDPRNEAYFGTDFDDYRCMSTVDLVDAPPVPLLISYAELDPIQMQVQAGELFARLVNRHGFAPEIQVVRGHNHLTQVYSINTEDDALAGSLLDFVRNCPAVEKT
jgi:triacylglycerol lipase